MPDLPIPFDYDNDPERFRANEQAVSKFAYANDVHADVARRFAALRLRPVLDLGCGEGRFTRPAAALRLEVVAFDLSATMLAALSGRRVQGDAAHLPFPDGAFGAVAALYMLYHLPDPRLALAECRRVLCPGGVLAASAPSRFNDPELDAYLPPSPPGSFEAENGAELVSAYFENLEVERWDVPAMRLPDAEALALYLRGRGLSAAEIAAALPAIPTPLTLTKRGLLVYARSA